MQKCALIFLVFIIWTKGFSQSVSISPIKTRVFYQWIDNPLQVVVENTPCNSLVVKAEKGKLEGKECDYIYIANDTVLTDVIKVGIKKGGKIKWISEQDFLVKKLPNPSIIIGNWIGKEDTANKNALLVQTKLTLPFYDFGFCSFTNEDRQTVTSYTVTIYRNTKVIFSEVVTSNLLTEKFKNFINYQSLANDKIVFDNIVSLLYQKEIRRLDQIFSLILKD